MIKSKHHILAFLFLVVTFQSIGQNYLVIDSLKKALKTAPTETRIEILNQIGWEYRLSKPDTTILFSQMAYDLALQSNKFTDASVSLNYMGIAYGYKGDPVQSFFHYEQSVELFKQHMDSSQLAYAYNNIGRLLFSQADMVKSYEYFSKALLIFEKNNDLAGLGYTYQSLVRLYQSQENYPKALEVSKKVLKIREDTKNIRGQISSLQEIATILEDMKDYVGAQNQLDRSRAIALSINDNISISEIDLNLSSILLRMKNFDEALNYCDKAQQTANKNSNDRLIVKINLQFGKIYYSTKQFNIAEEYLLKVIDRAKKSGFIEPLEEAYYYLFLINDNRGSFKHALENFKSHIVIKDSVSNTEIARTMENLENRIEIEKKDKENKLLKIREEQNELLINSEKNKSAAYMIVIILVVVAIALLLIYLRQKIKHEKLLTEQKAYIEQQNQKIHEQNLGLEKRNSELADLNTEKDNLMNIVAHDLKSPFNNLKGLCQLVELAGKLNEEQKNYVKIMREVSDKGANLTRDILDVNAFQFDNQESLVPVSINIYDFIKTKADAFKADAESKSITIQTFSADSEIEVLTDEGSLSRILDNLVSNSIKYSGENTTILLKSNLVDDKLQIAIADQGPGFSEEDKKHVFKKFVQLSARPTAGETSNGLGLAIVKTLIDRIHGKITLDSTLGKGSEFIVELPLKLEKRTKHD